MRRRHSALFAALLALLPLATRGQETPSAACAERRPTSAPVLGGARHREALAAPTPPTALGRAGLLSARDLMPPPPPGCAGEYWLIATPAVARGVMNSAYAVDRYEGALWAGRGMSTSLTAGVAFEAGPLTIVVVPEVTWQQNRDFEIQPNLAPGRPALANPWHPGIDWPQRQGTGPFARVGGGASAIRVDFGGFEAGVSTENLWMGPSLRYPLLLSNAAPGFPHLALRSPSIGIGIGTAEVALFLGRLEESPYFDSDPTDDYRSLSGFSMLFRPGAGFSVGGALLRHRTSERIPPLVDLFSFAKSPFSFLRGEDDDDNGLMSIFVRWEHPESGFEVHAEWGREDFVFDLNDLLTDAEYTRGYTLGLTKAGEWGPREILILAELTHLSDHRWYTNGDVPQGHTHDGQLLGAYVGPGSEAQFLSLDVTGAGGDRWSWYGERVRWDEFSYRNRFLEHFGFRGHDVELRTGIGLGRHVGPLVLDATAGIGFRRNRSFLDLESWTFAWKPNFEADVALAWIPPVR